MSTFIYSIDLGTAHCRLVVAEQDNAQPIGVKIVHLEEVQSYGVKRGQVYNPDEVIRTIRSLFANADKKLSKKIGSSKRVYCMNINGLQFKGGYMSTDIDVSSKQRIDERDIRQIIDLQKSEQSNKKDNYIISIEPVAYSIDGMPDSSSVIGVNGDTLRCTSYIITTSQKNISLLNNCLPTISLNQVYTTASAKARVLLPSSCRNKCVALIDIGAGVINIAVLQSNTTRFEVSIPLGANLITSDISNELNIGIKEAEIIKQNMQSILAQQSSDLSIKFSEENIVTINPKELRFIALARVEELSAYIESSLNKSNMLPCIEAIYLTGGGALSYGIIDTLKKRLEKNNISLCSSSFDGYDSKFAASIGMAMLYAKNNPSQEAKELPFAEEPSTTPEQNKEEFKLTSPEPTTNKQEEKKPNFKTKIFDFTKKLETFVTGGEEPDDTLN
ncbi:MAG: cell division FtsA domain-containing protein [Bacteroidia bacterium]|nr:cell division FtsA domain-containing protein [Bacteroidia bacterium]